MPSDNFTKLIDLSFSFNRANHTDEEYAAHKMQRSALMDSLEPAELYQYHLESSARVMGGTPESKDEEIAEICGSNELADKLAWVENFLSSMGETMKDIEETNVQLKQTIDSMTQSLNRIESSMQKSKKIRGYNETIAIQPATPPTLQ